MKNSLLALPLLLLAAAARADQGCIEVSSTTTTAVICAQFDCIEQGAGGCTAWACTRTQTTKFQLPPACSRIANCGKNAVFAAGAPQASDEDSTEQCDWYPCVQADAATGACTSYMCVSKRVTQTARTVYPDARCVPLPQPARPQPAAQPAQKAAPQPAQQKGPARQKQPAGPEGRQGR